MALIDGHPRMADAVTVEPCDLLMLDREEFIRCVEENPRIALGVMASLAERLREAAVQQESQQRLDVLGRVSELLLELARTYGADDPAGGTRIGTRITQQEIAEQIGATRESVNRALSNLKKVGALRSQGRQWIVLSAKKLRAYSAK